MKQKKLKRRIVIYMITFILVAVLIDVGILGYLNRKQVNRTAQVILDQVENVLIKNEASEEYTLESLKVDYVRMAHTVAYILEQNEKAQYSTEEFKNIAELMDIDEINLFDDQGTIYSGTHPDYFGLNVNDGEQIAYFKPMLEDKSLEMCQDVTPNTYEAKHMMYANVWNQSGTYIVQVGVEPVRLLEQLRQNEIHQVINQMPAYDGMEIFVAAVNDGNILGATEEALVATSIYDQGFLSKSDDVSKVISKIVNIDGYTNYLYFRQYGDYLIGIKHSTKVNVEGFIISIVIELVWLLIAGTIIAYTMLKLANANKKIKDQMSVVASVSEIYYSMHLIDMTDFSIEKLEGNERMDAVVREGNNAADMLRSIVQKTILDDYVEAAVEFVNLETLGQRLKGKKSVFMDARDKNVGWLRMSFITIDEDENQLPSKVMITTQVIDEDKKREEELSFKVNRDEMTGLYNRRAYEDDIMHFPDVPPEPDFVYAAIDINGLKVANDEYGHIAGDELIKGTAECLKRTLGNYGKVYRTGGDEFVSIFFADEEHFKAIVEDLEMATLEWRGCLVDNLAISVGYVTKREFQEETVENMAKIADQRMYEAKERYYAREGIDRKGQAAAHTALCNLYTKILKINLTEDSFAIVNMDENERTQAMGFADRISDWLSRFGKSGQVHPEDLEEYLAKTDLEFLKEYFKGDKTSISIHYRRKYANGFKQVVMEMIPANDYSDENQSLFLYVKDIDK